MMKTSQDKDIIITKIIRALKEIAFDDPSLKSAVDKVLVVLRELYGEEEDEYYEDDFEEYCEEQDN